MYPSGGEVDVVVEDPVCVITLNRPEKLNALTYPMLADIRAALAAASADPAVVGIVITGAGRGFCSGLDAEVLRSTTTTGSSGRVGPSGDDLPGMFSYFMQVPKPIVAAVNGVAAGGGFVLAMMSDLRFAAPTAAFTTIFSKRGLTAEHGTSWTLPRLTTTGRALDLLWTSRKVDANEAYRLGLVEYLTGPTDVVDRARAYLEDLADSVSPASIADAKRMVYRHAGMGYVDALPEADRMTWEALDRPDATEGALSLLERRAPKFPRLEVGPA